jgi:hypothetical protein
MRVCHLLLCTIWKLPFPTYLFFPCPLLSLITYLLDHRALLSEVKRNLTVRMALKTTTGGAIKYTVELHRKDGVSEGAFMHWSTNGFLPAAVPIMKKHNILKYAVVSAYNTATLTGRVTDTCDRSKNRISKSARPSGQTGR